MTLTRAQLHSQSTSFCAISIHPPPYIRSQNTSMNASSMITSAPMIGSVSHLNGGRDFCVFLSLQVRLTCCSGYVTAKTFCGNKMAKMALPLRYRQICQGVLPLSTSSGPLLSTDVRERGIVKYYCQDRQETRLGVLETL